MQTPQPVRGAMWGLAALGTAVVLWEPPLISFGVAVFVAICWCVWLDGHRST